MMRVLAMYFLVCIPLCLQAQETVKLTAADGQKLCGTLTRPPAGVALKGGVVLLPMHRSNRTAFAAFAPRLAAKGLMSLAVDLRGHGDSTLNEQGTVIDVPREAAPDHPALSMHDDVAAAHDALIAAGVPAGSIVWLGGELGANVALRAAGMNTRKPAALVLLTPMKSICSLVAASEAIACKELRTLVLAANEDAEFGAKPVVQALGAKATLRTLTEQNILGTRMLGHVPGLDADLITWMEESLSSELVLDIGLVKSVVLDGELGSTEEEGCTVVAIPLPSAAGAAPKQARMRLARNRSKLLFGIDIPERYLHNNAVTVFIDGSGAGPGTPNSRCFAFDLRPQGARHELKVLRGAEGAWKAAEFLSLQSYMRTNEVTRWTAELAVPLELLGSAEGQEVRIAFMVHGQKKDEITFYPAGVGMDVTPRRWVRARLR
ncbi:MAG: hypothetical protein EXS14_08935 [Planctomycetes bacterium]|nr:hypothetical protein [Planctomycetota bacterium]